MAKIPLALNNDEAKDFKCKNEEIRRCPHKRYKKWTAKN